MLTNFDVEFVLRGFEGLTKMFMDFVKWRLLYGRNLKKQGGFSSITLFMGSLEK